MPNSMRESLMRLASVAGIVVLLTACASPARKEALVVDDASFGVNHPYSVNVTTSGGGATEDIGYTNISNEDLAAAIEESITNSGLFSKIVSSDTADYRLNVALVSMSKPMFGFTFKIDMEMAWSLIDKATGEAVMRESIVSTHTATVGDAAVAVTRIKLAIEGAAQKNISLGLRKIAALKLR